MWQSAAGWRTTIGASCRYQLSANLAPDGQRCLTVQIIARREISLNPFLASIRVRPSVSSPASSSFTPVSANAYCAKRPSNHAFKYSDISSFISNSDPSSSSPPSLYSDIVASVLPLSLVSLLRAISCLICALSSVSIISRISSPVSPLPSY